MKRIVIALSLLLVVISTSFVTAIMAENAIDKSCAALVKCVQKERDEAHDALKIKDALETWNHNKKILFAIMFHDDFSEIENRMIELEYFSEHPDFDKSSEISFEIAKMLDALREEFKVSFENIF